MKKNEQKTKQVHGEEYVLDERTQEYVPKRLTEPKPKAKPATKEQPKHAK